MRAARLETRLGFRIDPHSEELIANALPLLDRVSGPRIYHELMLIFQEPRPEIAIRRLDDLHALSQIHSELRGDRWIESKFAALREELDRTLWGLKPSVDFFMHTGLLSHRMEVKSLQEFIERLQIGRNDSVNLQLSANLRLSLPDLAAAQRPSQITNLLEPYPAPVLALCWIADDRQQIRRNLARFQMEWRLVRPVLGGNDLKGLGLKPSPLFGRLLRELRNARLDGLVSTREDEEALVHNLLESWEMIR